MFVLRYREKRWEGGGGKMIGQRSKNCVKGLHEKVGKYMKVCIIVDLPVYWSLNFSIMLQLRFV
jgi:hypothetical protein